MKCTICLSKIEKDYISCKKCIYKYHSECLEEWINHSRSTKCPICKTTIKIKKTLPSLNKCLGEHEKYQQLDIQGYYNTNLFENQFIFLQSMAIKCKKYIAVSSIVVLPIVAIGIINFMQYK